ncbi:MAG: family 78 glycoside hydrolase catalytic domain [Verrucomicrobiota bacterium]
MDIFIMTCMNGEDYTKRIKELISFLLLLTILTFTLSSCSRDNIKTKVINLRCEYLYEPLGLDVTNPRFTWEYNSQEQDFTQKSYFLEVASSEELLQRGNPDIWSSSEIKISNSFAVYGGKALESYGKYYWHLRVTDIHGNLLKSSQISTFEMAKIRKSDWKAQWITDDQDKNFKPSPLFRKTFKVDKEVKQARLYVTGLGYYELFVNGDRAGRSYLDPGFTDFRKRVLYATHDVTKLLKKGDNAIAAVLGNGWFNIQSLAVWHFETASWRKRPQLLCELRIEYLDGQVETIISDNTWKTNTGGYLANDLYSGDTYDARLEEKGWKTAVFNDVKWKPVKVTGETAPILLAQQMPPITIQKELTPVAVKKYGKNIYVFDMGINLTGFCSLRINGEAGTRITLRHGELLKPNGRLEQGNIDIYFQRDFNWGPIKKVPNQVFQMDTYILKGDTVESFTPGFTYHGFQYVEVESSKPITLTKDDLTALFIHTSVRPVGSFSCSNNLLNEIWKATNQSYLSNLHSIPTDCPHREKNGWTGDTQLTIDFGLLSFDGITFFEKWMNDFIDNQNEKGAISGIIPDYGWGYKDFGPIWDGAMFIIPKALENYYGDTRSIEKLYPTCQKYLQYLESCEKDGTVTRGLGDWLPYKTKTPAAYLISCYYFLCNELMAQFADRLGKDPTTYTSKADELKLLINKKYFKPDSAIYANGSQTAQAVALELNIVPKDFEQKVADKLHENVQATGYHLDFGLLGSRHVLAMLTRYGYIEDAYKMAAQETVPSWGNFIKRGLSTLAETWIMSPEFKDASLNHRSFGSVSSWMYKDLAGINYDNYVPGFKHIIIHPHFAKELQWVKGEYNSVNGMVRSEWRRDGDKVILTVTIPPNTTATIFTNKEEKVVAGTYVFIINATSKNPI